MKRLKLTIITALLLALQPILAQSTLKFTFNRNSGNPIVTSALNKVANEEITASIAIAPVNETNAPGGYIPAQNNGTDSNLTAEKLDSILIINRNTTDATEADPNTYTLTISNLPANYTFTSIKVTGYAVNSAGKLQGLSTERDRNFKISYGKDANNLTTLNAELKSICDNSHCNGTPYTHEFTTVGGMTNNNKLVIKVQIYTDGGSGCFYGLSAIEICGLEEAVGTEPTPTPTPDETGAKVYYISWKNTGANYITEEPDNRMTVQGSDVTKAQFWKFIPTGKDNCYYIKNTATDRYMGSCNLVPSSNSKIYTSESPVEYYVGKTAATTGENANCWYLSSTDCADYSNESSSPRALNKDGASNYIITWSAAVSNVGSYWKFIETEDLYEVRPFAASAEIGKIGTSYNMATNNGKYLTITDDGVVLGDYDAFDENNEWYFVGTGNATGWQIASASEPATVIGIQDGKITAAEGLTTKWKVNASKQVKDFFYFTSEGTTLKFGEDSLFRFDRIRSAFVRSLKIYKNPCGATSDNYAKKIEIRGEGAIDNILYEAESKPGTWHVMCANDKGVVAKGEKFNINMTLNSNAANGLTAIAHFDWNSDGIFETAVPLALNGTAGTAEVAVPDWASEEQTRMRLRVNSNGLDLAEDDVYGFIYDFHIKVATPQVARTVTVGTNSWERGTVELSEVAESYDYGKELTAKATALGTAQFVCWKEEGVVVSTEAEYTFTIDHNVKLVAYFSPNTDESSYPTATIEVIEDCDVKVEQQGNSIVAGCTSKVQAMTLYTVDAAAIATSRGNVIDVATVREGLYIVNVTTADGYKNVKIFIKK